MKLASLLALVALYVAGTTAEFDPNAVYSCRIEVSLKLFQDFSKVLSFTDFLELQWMKIEPLP